MGAKRSATGKPLFVAGPQVGHFYPGILLELDLDGGGFRARGAAFPGLSFSVLLGRGIDYAWSATAAGSDIVDQYVETLCHGSDVMYLYRGECRAMTTFEAGTIMGRPGEPDRPLVFRETVHGPVTGYATVGGKASCDLDEALDTGPRAARVARFFLGYVHESRSLGEGLPPLRRPVRADVQLALRGPPRHRGVHEGSTASAAADRRPRLADARAPASTSGSASCPPRGTRRPINPPSGLIVNWNNKPARGDAAADHEWTWGSVQRVDLLWAGIEAAASTRSARSSA